VSIRRKNSFEKYNVLLICTYYDVLEEKLSIEILKKQFIDGFIFISGYNKG
jgi:DNA-binding LacI/PurR family transcriptional regulator